MSKVALECFLMPITGKPTIGRRWAIGDSKRHCEELEDSLGDKEYFTNRHSIVDFSIGCLRHTFCLIGLDTSCFPKLNGWLRRLLGRQSMKRAMADSQAAT